MRVITVDTQFHNNTTIVVDHIVAIYENENGRAIIQIGDNIQWTVKHSQAEVLEKIVKCQLVGYK